MLGHHVSSGIRFLTNLLGSLVGGKSANVVWDVTPDLYTPAVLICPSPLAIYTPMSSLLFVSVKPWGQECPEIHRQAKDSSWSHPVWVLCIWSCSCHMFTFIIYEAGIDFLKSGWRVKDEVITHFCDRGDTDKNWWCEVFFPATHELCCWKQKLHIELILMQSF